MCPILFDFGEIELFGLTIPLRLAGYGAMYALGILVGWVVFTWTMRSVKRDGPWTDVYFQTVIAGVIGGKALNGLTVLPRVLDGSLPPIAILSGGGVWLGGVLGGVAFVAYRARKLEVPVGVVMNGFFVGVPIAHAVGRIGCLLGGCCYGAPSEMPWAITFTHELAHRYNGTPLHVPLHPTALYEIVAEVALFGVALYFWRRHAQPWSILALWSCGYGAARMIIELFRGDAIRGHFLFLSTSQWISLGMIVFGALIIAIPLKGRLLAGPKSA